jgi:crossover junction endodeoxyribonuclease RuvC
MMTLIGIDPGASGAIVALLGNTVLRSEPLPVAKKVGLLLGDFADIVEGIARAQAPGAARFIVERAQSFPRQGISSAFNYGRDYGAILGVLAALSVSYETVPAHVWHAAICGKRPSEGRAEAKARALQAVQQRLPHLHLPTTIKVREGIVDAACLALWGQLMHVREAA